MTPLPLRLHRYRDGRISAWLTNYEDALLYWHAVKGRLIEPTLSVPLRTSPSIWRVDYMDLPKEAKQ
jgi:hypothetical protein